MWPNPQFPADLVTFIDEILNGKLHFLRCGHCVLPNYPWLSDCVNLPVNPSFMLIQYRTHISVFGFIMAALYHTYNYDLRTQYMNFLVLCGYYFWVLVTCFFISKIILFYGSLLLSNEYFSKYLFKCLQSMQEFQFYIHSLLFFHSYALFCHNTKKCEKGANWFILVELN